MAKMPEVFVVKIGGNVVDNPEALTAFIQQFAAIESPCVLVHGGGKLATRLAQALGIEQKMVEGRRITDEETLKIVTMVYAGGINKDIVARLQANGVAAIGLSGADGNLIKAHKRKAGSGIGKSGLDYGFAGDVDEVNASMLYWLLDGGYTPVVAPITHDQQGQLLNTNADTIAATLAKALASKYSVRLIYCFEKPGVLLDVNDDASVIDRLDQHAYAALKASGALFEGILPKIDNAFLSLDQGVQEVLIGHAGQLLQNAGSSPAGTLIYKEAS